MSTPPSDPDKSPARDLARAYLSPPTQAAMTVDQYDRRLDDLDLLSLVTELQVQVEAAQSGDLRRADEMLVSQAHTLDRLFNTLLQDAAASKRPSELALYLKYALRAQAQARGTWEALAAMKSPRSVAFIGQNNIANVQQVNNAAGVENPDGAGSSHENAKSKVMELDHEQRLDARTTETAIGADPGLEAVAPVHRAKVG
jgi:hypothetical protein